MTTEGTSDGSEIDDIQHLVRIAGTDLDGTKSVQYSLTGLKGVGIRVSRVITRAANVDPNETMGRLSEEQVDSLKNVIESIEENMPLWMLNRRRDFYTGEDKHIVGGDLLLSLREDLNLMKKTRSYKGIRHERGHKVRGQRTKSTGRKGTVVGVSRRKGA
ncbi:MAG: 30S ribosomal protein S13 [Halobacteriota archaeon]|nr:30S ribosomal protein S13 [Halobacteriota archaeon]